MAQVTDAKADFGRAHWTFGTTPFGFLPDGSVLAAARRNGSDTLVRVDLATGAVGEWDATYPQIDDLFVGEREVALVAGNPRQPMSLVTIDFETRVTSRGPARLRLHARPGRRVRAARDRVRDGRRRDRPRAPLRAAQPGVLRAADERPPLLVRAHGGPVGSSFRSLNLPDPVLHDARIRGARRGLRGDDRLRPDLPRATATAVGDRRPRRLRVRGAEPGRCGRRRSGTDRDPRRERRRLHDLVRAHVPELLRGRRFALRDRGPFAARGQFAQVRGALDGLARRGVPRR